jgi:acetyltransferase-like isoleucine patch superfamily enzyme
MKNIKKYLTVCILNLFLYLGQFISNFIKPAFLYKMYILRVKFYSGWISSEFKFFGKHSTIHPGLVLVGGKYISISDNSTVGKGANISAWDSFQAQIFSPNIHIGKNVSIGNYSHITAINKIVIEDNVLTGKNITITDNSHGENNLYSRNIPPLLRNLCSNGPVIIKEGVWIGDKVTILSNCVIGKNVIIGSNSVVTKDFPDNCIVAGVPAKIIKYI